MLSTAVRTVEDTKGLTDFLENSRFLTASANAEVMIVLSLSVKLLRKMSFSSSMERRKRVHLFQERSCCRNVFLVFACSWAVSAAEIRSMIRSLVVGDIWQSFEESVQGFLKEKGLLVGHLINDCHVRESLLRHFSSQETIDCSPCIYFQIVSVHDLEQFVVLQMSFLLTRLCCIENLISSTNPLLLCCRSLLVCRSSVASCFQ